MFAKNVVRWKVMNKAEVKSKREVTLILNPGLSLGPGTLQVEKTQFSPCKWISVKVWSMNENGVVKRIVSPGMQM